MTLGSNSFDSRLRRLEEFQNTFEVAKPMLVTTDGAETILVTLLLSAVTWKWYYIATRTKNGKALKND